MLLVVVGNEGGDRHVIAGVFFVCEYFWALEFMVDVSQKVHVQEVCNW